MGFYFPAHSFMGGWGDDLSLLPISFWRFHAQPHSGRPAVFPAVGRSIVCSSRLFMMANTQTKITHKSISDYRPQARNVNLGSERGLQAIEDSLSFNGAGRSLVSDKDGEIIAGSQTIQAAENAGIREVIEVETTGDVLVVVRRADLDIDGLGEAAARAKALSIADNRAHELSYAQDDVVLAELLAEIRNEDEDMLRGALMSAGELDALLNLMSGGNIDSSPVDIPAQYMILVECGDEQHQASLLERFISQGLRCRALIS